MSLRAYIAGLPGAEFPSITAEQGRALDQYCVEHLFVNVEQLMELAGLRVAEFVAHAYPDASFAVLAGKGGNGGDALVAARHLANWGHKVTVELSTDEDELTRITAHQLHAVRAMKIRVARRPKDLEYTDTCVILDGMLGFGAKGTPYGKTARLIEQANDSVCPIISIDVPSGMDSTTGDASGFAIKAAATVALTLPKRGLISPSVTGEIVVADIGVPAAALKRIGVPVKAPFAAGPLVRWER